MEIMEKFSSIILMFKDLLVSYTFFSLESESLDRKSLFFYWPLWQKRKFCFYSFIFRAFNSKIFTNLSWL